MPREENYKDPCNTNGKGKVRKQTINDIPPVLIMDKDWNSRKGRTRRKRRPKWRPSITVYIQEHPISKDATMYIVRFPLPSFKLL